MRGILMLAIALCAASSAPAHASRRCAAGPFIVFFEPNLSALKREQIEILDTLIEILTDCGSPVWNIAGHADTAEDPAIVKDRVQAVRNYLATRGLFVTPENMKDFGARKPRVATGPDISERQNRRVEIMYGPAAP